MSNFITTERLRQFFNGLKGVFAPINHASGNNIYGLGSDNNYGHVKLITGNMNGKTYVSGEACSTNHTHSQYLTAHQSLSNYVTKDELHLAISGLFHYRGSISDVNAFSTGVLDSAHSIGDVYNVSTAFTTNSRFIEGAGHSYPAGTNIVIVDGATDGRESGYLVLDVLSGAFVIGETSSAEIEDILSSDDH